MGARAPPVRCVRAPTRTNSRVVYGHLLRSLVHRLKGFSISAVALLLALIAAVALTACGDGGGTPVPDTSPPTVVATNPPADALGVQVTDLIVVNFSERIAPSSVTASSFVIEDDAGHPVTGGIRQVNGSAVTFSPASSTFMKSQHYQVKMTTDITDLAGNALVTPFTFGFTISTDTWTETATANAPQARALHTAVWTGKEMIVWGGTDGSLLRTGGRYDPLQDTWADVNDTGAPSERANHTAVWANNEMIVWGGDTTGSPTNTGGVYTPPGTGPGTGTWTTISSVLPNTPTPRSEHTAVWTGSVMVVWGGATTGPMPLNTGGRFNPIAGGSWHSTNAGAGSGVPTPRTEHSAVWTGTEMIVWGGIDGLGVTNTGARYNPTTNTWKAMADAPIALAGHTAVWTGSEMIVWGGVTIGNFLTQQGARYNPTTNTWKLIATNNAPLPTTDHSAVWTGSEMIVWGGTSGSNRGHAYRPASDTWRVINATDPATPSPRIGHTAVWTGTEMIVWGGTDSGPTSAGGRYTP